MPKVSDAVPGAGAAPARPGRKEAILSFASDLRKRLPLDADDAAAAGALLGQVQKQAQAVEKYAEKAHRDVLGDEDLEREGTDLWNVCTRLNREGAGTPADGKPPARSKLHLWGRVLAFHILHLCQWSPKSTAAVACHLLRLALKVARFCIDDHDAQTSRLVLQRATDYRGRLQDLSKEGDDSNECLKFDTEWTVLRIALAWQDDQFDVAEHLFAGADELLKKVGPASAESIIDVLFHIGKSMLSREDFQMAEKWLRRAWDAINSQQLQEMSRDAVELRIVILQSLVGALIGLETTDGAEDARNLIKYMESEIGDQPVILLLSLELLTKTPAEALDCEAYANILRRMIRTFRSKDSSFKLLLHHIRKLHSKSPGLGCSVLDEFLTALAKAGAGVGPGAGQSSWVDKLVVIRIYLAISQRDYEGTVEAAENVLSRLEQAIGSDASYAAHMLIWKKIESNYSQGQYSLAEGWCRLALSPALVNSGPMNIGKLHRKLLLCAIARSDLDSARSIFYSMSEGSKRDPNTQYLMYKVAVRSGDRAMAAECLEAVAQASPKRPDFLYACVADSQHSKDKLVAIDALKKLAGVYDLEHPGQVHVHLPALLRCTIMLLHTVLESSEAAHQDRAEREFIITDLCSVFDAVVVAAEKMPKGTNGTKLFDARELEWFCRNSYNLGIKHASDWKLGSVVQILSACVRLIRRFPDDIPRETAADLSLKSIFCNFLISSALVSLARSQDSLEEQLQKYLVMRRHVADADSEVQKRLESKSLDEVSSADLVRKLAFLFSFDFEAAVALKQWQELGEIVLKASACRDLEAFKMMADCILRGHAPPEELFSVLRKIINEISALEESDPARLAKYTRCLFQTISATNEELGGRVLDEACRMASEAHGTPSAWPREELEWFASASYNHSIDLWGRGENEACRWWAQKAMSIAHYCGDGGQLEGMLQEKYVRLRLDDDGGGEVEM